MNKRLFAVFAVATFGSLASMQADPLAGSAFTVEIRCAPVFAFKDGTGKQYGALETVFSEAATLSLGSPSVTSTGPLAPAPAGAAGNNLFLKAQAEDYAPVPGAKRLLVNLEGAVSAPGLGGLKDLGLRITELTSAQAPPPGKAQVNDYIVFELLSVDFPAGTWVELMTNSRLQQMNLLPAPFDPAVETIDPDASSWVNVLQDGGFLPLITGGSSICPDPEAVRFRFALESNNLALDMQETAALRWAIFYRQPFPGLVICEALLFPDSFSATVLRWLDGQLIPKNAAAEIQESAARVRKLAQAVNGAATLQIAKAEFERLKVELEDFENTARGFQAVMAPEAYSELERLFEGARDELARAIGWIGPGSPDLCLHSEKRYWPLCGDYFTISFTSSDPTLEMTSADIDLSGAGLSGLTFGGWGSSCGIPDPAEVIGQTGLGTQVLHLEFSGFLSGMELVVFADIVEAAPWVRGEQFVGAMISAGFSDGTRAEATYLAFADTDPATIAAHSCPYGCLFARRGYLNLEPSCYPCSEEVSIRFASSDLARRLVSVTFDLSASVGAIGAGVPPEFTTSVPPIDCPFAVGEADSATGLGSMILILGYTGLEPGITGLYMVDISSPTTLSLGLVFPLSPVLDGTAVTATFNDGGTAAVVLNEILPVDTPCEVTNCDISSTACWDIDAIVGTLCPILTLHATPSLGLTPLELFQLDLLIRGGRDTGSLSDRAAAALAVMTEEMDAAVANLKQTSNPRDIASGLDGLEASLDGMYSAVIQLAGGDIKHPLAAHLLSQIKATLQSISRARFANLREVCDGKDNDGDGEVDEGFDVDADGIANCLDNCPEKPNPGQEDSNRDGVGDACASDPPPEICGDGKDNNGDGKADENCGGVRQTCLYAKRGLGIFGGTGGAECGDHIVFSFDLSSPDPFKRLESVTIDGSPSGLGTVVFNAYPCNWTPPAAIAGISGFGTQILSIDFTDLPPGTETAVQLDIDRSASTAGTVLAAEFSGTTLTASFSDGETLTVAFDLSVDRFAISANSCPPLSIEWPLIRDALAARFAGLTELIHNGDQSGDMTRDAAGDLNKLVEGMAARLNSINPGGEPQIFFKSFENLADIAEVFKTRVADWARRDAISKPLAAQLDQQTLALLELIASAKQELFLEYCDGRDNDFDGSIDEDLDRDRDGVPDCQDNCPGLANPGQEDLDHDRIGDGCEGGQPLREVCDGADNDDDGLIDEGFDPDRDGIADCKDNCPNVYNPLQGDKDGDGLGTLCDASERAGKANGFFSGDFNSDLAADISDAIGILEWLFLGRGKPQCQISSDLNGDDAVDVSDAIGLLEYLFLGRALPQVTFGICQSDPALNDLNCPAATCATLSECETPAKLGITIYYANQTNTAGPWNGLSPITGFQNIQEAIDAASPNDGVVVLPGTYAENLVLPSDVNLSACADGPAAVIDGGASTLPAIAAAGNNLIFGLIIRGGLSGIDCDLSGLLTTTLPDPSDPEPRLRVWRCEIKETGDGIRVAADNVLDGFAAAARIEGLVEIANNYIHDLSTAGAGIRLLLSSVSPPGSEEIQIGIRLEHNVLHNLGQGILLDAEGPGSLSCGSGCGDTSFSGFIMNNLIFDASTHGITLRGREMGAAGVFIINNTLADLGAIPNQGHGIQAISESGGTARPAVLNNIICGNSGAGYIEDGTASDAIDLSYNLFFDNGLANYEDFDGPAAIDTEAGLNDPSFSEFFSGCGNQVELFPFDPFVDGTFYFSGAPITTGPAAYFLDQSFAANPAINGGNFPATDLDLGARTTAASGAPDVGIVDIGFHFPLP